jgi:TPR repeat protein
MASYLKRADWIALGVGMAGLPLLMPFNAAFQDYGLSGKALASLLDEKYRMGVWIGLVFEIFYVPSTFIALRAVGFRPLLKYPFCLLVFPVFVAFMAFNVAWSTAHLSAFLGHPERLSTEVTVLAATPLPLLVCALWYLLFAGLDRVLPRPDEFPKLHKAVNVLAVAALVGFAVSVVWAITHRGGEIERGSKPEEWSVTEAKILASSARRVAMPTTTLAAQPIRPGPEEMIALLRAGKFSELEARISVDRTAYEAASDGEWDLLQAIAVFERIDPDLETAFNAWVAAQPQSYSARAARGAYFYKRAWAFRGTRYVRDTPSESLAAMRELFKRAKDDLLASRRLSSRPQVSDRYLIGIAMAEGDQAAARRIYLEAVAGDPDNYGARRAFLNTLRREWGGSLDAMHAFVEETAAAAQTPKQRAVANYLEASLLGYLGMHHHSNGHKRALKLYDAALAKAEDPKVLARRAQLLVELKRADEALRDAERAIELDPTSAEALEYRGVMREQRKQMSQALDDYRRAAAYGSTYAMQRLGIIYLTGGDVPKNYREAAKWLQLGAQFGEDRAQNYLGWMYSEGAGVPRDARRALELWYASAAQGNEDARGYLHNVPWYWRARFQIEERWPF